MRQRSSKMGICDHKMIQFMPANYSNTDHVITILIHSDRMLFQNVFITLLRLIQQNKDVTSSLLSWHKRYDFNAANFDVTANENARYKRNELKYKIVGNPDQKVSEFAFKWYFGGYKW